MKADPIALAAEWAVLVQLAPARPDLELADLNWADSALSGTLAAPVAEWPVVSLVAPDDTPGPLTVTTIPCFVRRVNRMGQGVTLTPPVPPQFFAGLIAAW